MFRRRRRRGRDAWRSRVRSTTARPFSSTSGRWSPSSRRTTFDGDSGSRSPSIPEGSRVGSITRTRCCNASSSRENASSSATRAARSRRLRYEVRGDSRVHPGVPRRSMRCPSSLAPRAVRSERILSAPSKPDQTTDTPTTTTVRGTRRLTWRLPGSSRRSAAVGEVSVESRAARGSLRADSLAPLETRPNDGYTDARLGLVPCRATPFQAV